MLFTILLIVWSKKVDTRWSLIVGRGGKTGNFGKETLKFIYKKIIQKQNPKSWTTSPLVHFIWSSTIRYERVLYSYYEKKHFIMMAKEDHEDENSTKCEICDNAYI